MTWILGAGIIFGYGALISDVRATWCHEGKIIAAHDVLQKIYAVSPTMMAGFAGSVKIGFRLILSMQRAFKLPPDRMWEPRAVAWHWHRRARRIFKSYPDSDRQAGAALLLVGMSRDINRLCCIRMRCPDFEPEIFPSLKWASIGTGTEHENASAYTNDADSWRRFLDVWAHGEVNNPGGAAMAIAVDVAQALERHPMMTVSDRLQVGTVRLGSHTIKNLQRDQLSRSWKSYRLVESTGLMQSWEAFEQFADSEGLEASAASA